MCGRYATTRSATDLSAFFEAYDVTSGLDADYNVAPTDPVPVVRMSQGRGARVLDTARWGLVPPWATDLRGGARMINARSETVATSRAFGPSFARRRCLVPADGWFEWVRDGRARQAFYLTPSDGSVLAFAGLWSTWSGGTRTGGSGATGGGATGGGVAGGDERAGAAEQERLITCSVLTTAALGELTRVHERMPLILSADRWEQWLAGGGDAGELLRPPSAREVAAIELRPVGAAVGNVRNNGPDLVKRIDRVNDHFESAAGVVGFPTEATLF
jgi:putative SOS response-associated peptidase YedK